MTDEDVEIVHEHPPRRRRTWWLVAALLAAVVAGVLLAGSSLWDNRFTAEETAPKPQAAKQADFNPDAWCSAQATYDAIRRELFRRAAEVRGSDEQQYTRLADFALLRMSGPVVRGIDDRLHSVSCSGVAVLSLPPGVAADGGRRSLSGDIDYTIQPAADHSGNVIRLGNVDSLVIPLATLSRTAPSQPAPQPSIDLTGQPDSQVGQQPDMAQTPEPQQPPQPQPQKANPSFDCADASTRSEIAVCNDPGLAALDRQMASQFNRALMNADKGQRRLLNRTRDRFLAFRNCCGSNDCIANTYRSRMREISDIMADRWRG